MSKYSTADLVPTIQEFVAALDMKARSAPRAAYLVSSVYRQYRTLLAVLQCIEPGDRVLSLGAGPSFVEEYLAKFRNAEIYIVDFEEATEMQILNKYFKKLFIADVTEPNWSPQIDNIDIVLWLDNIEHVKVDPRTILEKLKGSLADGARIFITTDNFARLRNIFKLAFRRSIVAMPDQLFSETSYANEYVHRREYLLPELKSILNRAGFEFEHVEYFWQNKKVPFHKLPFFVFEWLCPIYRPHMLIRATRS
jgi:SAM-dependent methyltransferase